MIRCACVIFVALGLAIEAGAEDSPARTLWLDYSQAPSTALSPPLEHATIRPQQFSARYLVDLHEDDATRTGLAIGVYYAYEQQETDRTITANIDLHTLLVPLHFGLELTTWRLDARIAPGIMTSSNTVGDLDFDGEDFFAPLRITGRRALRANSVIVLGASYDRRFGETRMYPVAGIEADLGTRIRLFVGYPDLKFFYVQNPRLHWGLQAGPSGGQWQLLNDENDRRYDFRQQTTRLSLSAWYRARDTVWVAFGIGRDFNREFQFEDLAGRALDVATDDVTHLAVRLFVGARAPSDSAGCRCEEFGD